MAVKWGVITVAMATEASATATLFLPPLSSSNGRVTLKSGLIAQLRLQTCITIRGKESSTLLSANVVAPPLCRHFQPYYQGCSREELLCPKLSFFEGLISVFFFFLNTRKQIDAV